MENPLFISLRSVTKRYNNQKTVLQDFNLDIEEGSFVTIVGPSGSGKTSILNLIAGFTKPDSGEILLNGIDIKDISAHQRPTATVFQDYALFSHMTVFQNIAFGLHKMYTPKDHVKDSIYSKLKDLQRKAVDLSDSKLRRLNQEILSLNSHYEKYDQKWDLNNSKSCFKKLKLFYLKQIQKKINDLGYWKSFWQYYPVLNKKKISEKYLLRPLNKEEIAKKVFEIINLIGLTGHEYSDISTLSGGSKQKVALARSLVIEPKILLLDEPLAAIDKNIREKMQLEIKRLHEKLKITFVLITHDQKEALILSDKIVVINHGKIEQIGTPSEIYDSPINSWVANFMGKANLFDAIYLSPGKLLVKGKYFYTDIKEGFDENEEVMVMIRPEDYDVVSTDQGIISVEVIDSIYKGQLWELKCRFIDEIIHVENIDEVKTGEKIGLVWDIIDVHVMKHPNNTHSECLN